jgi:hypothetical protein
MKNTITVDKLLEQLTNLKKAGYGNSPIVYMDELSMTYDLEEGLHDIWHANNKTVFVDTIVLG